jgi:transposase
MAMGRPLVVAWAEDAATLRRLYLAEHDHQVRPRLHALWLIREGRSGRATAALVGAHERTVQEWVGWYRAGGIAAVRAPRRAGKGRAAKLSAEQQAQLVAQAATGAFFTVFDAMAWVADTFGAAYTPSGMYTLLGRLGCRKKVPRPMNPKTSAEAQAAWKGGAWSPPSPTPA